MIQIYAKRLAEGSSPLARGKHNWDEFILTTSRIIPARAGETGVAHGALQSGKDHPRSRGGNWKLETEFTKAVGSSPLARGKPVRFPDLVVNRRIIPARAGETSLSSNRSSQRTDHPRSRGGNSGRSYPQKEERGSSPLARGKHLEILGIPTMP